MNLKQPRISVLSLWLAVTLACLVFAGPGSTQEASSSDTPRPDVQREEIEALIATLENPEERRQFIERLRTLVETRPAGETTESAPGLADNILAVTLGGVSGFSAQFVQATDYFAQAPAVIEDVYAALLDTETQRTVIEALGKVTGVFLLALAVAFVFRRLLSRGWRSVGEREGRGPMARSFLLLASLILELIPLAALATVAYLALPIIDPREITRITLLALVNAHVVSQVVLIAARTVLSLEKPHLRPYRLRDETAAYLYIWIRRLTIVVAYGYFVTEALRLIGMAPAAHAMVVNSIGLFAAVLFITLVLQIRRSAASSIRGDSSVSGVMGQFRTTVARFWHLPAVVYIIGVYVVWAFEIPGGFAYLLQGTLVTLLAAVMVRVVLFGTERGLNRFFQIPEPMRIKYPQLENRANAYRPALGKIVATLIVTAGIFIVLEGWGVDSVALLTTEASREIITRLARIAFVIGISFLIWEVVSALIERQLKVKADTTSSRVHTLLPLIKNVVRIIIIVLGSMIVLSEIGMDIGPLLASAGVIGLAIGFGSQALVRDLMTGVFIVLEDIIGVGDWVEIGGHTGIVESMSVRTLRLRDLSGDIRVIPFGDVAAVHKVARDYSYALIVVGVAYRENTDQVIDVLNQVAEDMRNDPEWAPKILAPLEIQGVNDLGASSVDIRVRLKCRPQEQWGLRREFLRRTKLLFDAKGIEIPFPHQTIYFGQDRDGQAPPARVQLSGNELPPEGDQGSRDT